MRTPKIGDMVLITKGRGIGKKYKVLEVEGYNGRGAKIKINLSERMWWKIPNNYKVVAKEPDGTCMTCKHACIMHIEGECSLYQYEGEE